VIFWIQIQNSLTAYFVICRLIIVIANAVIVIKGTHVNVCCLTP